MEKKAYMKPEMRVYDIRKRKILCGSEERRREPYEYPDSFN